jgi:4-hydroxyacetophenone monooxygenase
MTDHLTEPGAPMESFLFTAQEIEAGLASSELIPLLLAVAAVTENEALLQDRFCPALLTPAVGVLAQGGLPADSLGALRKLLASELASLTTAHLELPALTDEFLMRCFSFMTGQDDRGYLPLLRRELNWGVDTDRPTRFVERAPKRVAIIGGGISGVAMAVRLRHADIDFVLFEKNPEIGGTWWENRYPGCRLDTSNFGYSYSFVQTTWQHYFSTREEVGAYVRRVAEAEGILPSVRFGQEVSSATWTGRSWSLVVDGTTEDFDFVVSAVGQLNRPKIPHFEGLDEFAGTTWHSAQWPEDSELTGKRVALVGTGASGYQIAPAIAPDVESLTIFQRTPPWILPTPGYSSQLPAGYLTLLDRLPAYRRWLRFYQFWVSMDGRMRFTHADPQWQGEDSVSEVNAEFRQVLERSLRDQFVGHPDLLAKMIPPYPPGSKRILRDDGAWAETLKRSNVDLEVDGIAQFDSGGIVTSAGRHIPLDAVVFATGFEADRFLSPMVIVGEGGRVLSEQWGDRAETYLGMSVSGFPNFAMLYGPNTNLVVNGSLVFLIECAVDRIIRMITFATEQDVISIDVPQSIVDEFVADIDRENESMAWGDPRVNNWYKGASGRVVSIWPFSMRRFWEQTRRDDFRDWTIVCDAVEAVR